MAAVAARGVLGFEGETGIELEAGHGVAAAGELQREAAVAADGAGCEMKRASLRRSFRQPGPDQRRRSEPQIFGREQLLRLLGLCARPCGGDAEAPDPQIVDHDVAPQRLRLARQKQGLVGNRQGQPRTLDRRLDKANLTLEQRRQRDLGIDGLRVEGRPILATEPQPTEAQMRRGKQPQVDRPLAAGIGTEGFAQRPVDQRAITRPVDEGRHGQGRHENQHDGARERGQEITHRYRFRQTCGPQGFVRGSRVR